MRDHRTIETTMRRRFRDCSGIAIMRQHATVEETKNMRRWSEGLDERHKQNMANIEHEAHEGTTELSFMANDIERSRAWQNKASPTSRQAY
ncbi:uncharacterized protein SPSK_01323 [Sporothrix schenckii 1099-18]|uniref:Uncharacterized protein n=1 Tax=Sporothrix schenckii 1099-18 TaxID=1397361 RepID=A0A0F2LUX5_SPOSC|nr:uncharacterized protein SPSK_01323 [Sporothrix schenckii 1099-18]KJR81267.1 hypothetical protein SPSK_01323 [Sporothrix schenckii 1099-18]